MSHWSTLIVNAVYVYMLIYLGNFSRQYSCRSVQLWIIHQTDGGCSVAPLSPLTHWGRDKKDAISQTTFSNAFSWMKLLEFWLKFHWNLFLRVQLTIFQHWFRYWLGAVQATSHYLNQCWLEYRRIYASLGLNELMRSRAIKRIPMSYIHHPRCRGDNVFIECVWVCLLFIMMFARTM